MPDEIGFVYIRAKILANDLIEKRIEKCDNYHSECATVKALLDAHYDIVDVPRRSRKIISKLIGERLKKWWQQSRYNVQIDTLRDEILGAVIDMLIKLDCKILKIDDRRILVDVITQEDFLEISKTISMKWNGIIMYHESIL